MAAKKTEKTNQSLESNMKELDTVLAQMEQEDQTLEQSFALYKKGMDLLLQCNNAIDKVEKELLILEENGFESGV